MTISLDWEQITETADEWWKMFKWNINVAKLTKDKKKIIRLLIVREQQCYMGGIIF